MPASRPTLKSTPATARRLTITNLAVQCAIGIHPHEREKPQGVLITVTIGLDAATEPVSDNISDTLDYDRVRTDIIAIASQRHYDLQETLARHLADHIMSLPHVIGVAVTTVKPNAYADCQGVAYRLVVGDMV